MVDLDVALTAKVCLEDIAVAMVPPPGAQLPVPGAVQHMEEFRVLHANHGEEVLVSQVATEVVLVSKLLHPRGLQQMAIEWRLAHGLQVQQHYPTVEAGESFRRRIPNSGLGVLMAELPECVPVKGKETELSQFGVNELARPGPWAFTMTALPSVSQKQKQRDSGSEATAHHQQVAQQEPESRPLAPSLGLSHPPRPQGGPC